MNQGSDNVDDLQPKRAYTVEPMPQIYNDAIRGEFDAESLEYQPTTKYIFICTTPRTAGHYMCENMTRIGWGMPVEYFNPTFALPFYRQWINNKCTNYFTLEINAKRFGEVLITRNSRNGIFSSKIFPQDLNLVQKTIKLKNPEVCFIHLTRQDKRAQTISLITMSLTQRPFDEDLRVSSTLKIAPSELNDASVENFFNYLCKQDQIWLNLFAQHAPVNFLRLTTEEIVSQPDLIMDRIATRFELALDPSKVKAISISKPYSQDAEIKSGLQQRFGPLLDRLQRKYDSIPR